MKSFLKKNAIAIICLLLALALLSALTFFGGEAPLEEDANPIEKVITEGAEQTSLPDADFIDEKNGNEVPENKEEPLPKDEQLKAEQVDERSDDFKAEVSESQRAEQPEAITEEATEEANPSSPKESESASLAAETPSAPPLQSEEPQVSKSTCTLVIRCDSVLKNSEVIPEAKRELIPPKGIIYPEQKVEFSEGESVFDVILRETKKNNIHFEFVKTVAYDSAYVEGIGGLYERDCGPYSGWLYKVNGIEPKYGSSKYKLSPGDRVEYIYSCNFLEKTP